MKFFDTNSKFFSKVVRALALTLVPIVLSACGGGDAVDALVGVKDGAIENGLIGNDSLEFTPSTHNFGIVGVGAPAAVTTITATNKSKLPITLKSFVSTASPDFTVTSQTCAANLALKSGEACNFVISFEPTVGGELNMRSTVQFYPTAQPEVLFQNTMDVTGTGVAPLAFAGLDPISASEVSTTKVMLRWPAITGASSIQIFSGTSSGALTLLGATSGSDTSFQVLNLSPSTTYFFQARALNLIGVPDTNTNIQSVMTDAIGSFNSIPTLSATEGVNSITTAIGNYCTDVEGNQPQFVDIDSQSDPDSQCTVLSSPFRISCTPNYKNGSSSWSSNVAIRCLLNDYPTPLTQTLSVSVANAYRPITLDPILGQNVIGGTSITPVQANGVSLDGETISYTCQYDNLVNGVVSGGAATCASLLNQDSSNATFAAGLLNWTPRLLDGNKSFEIRITATGDSSATTASQIFVINVGYPPPSPADSLITIASGSVASGTSTQVQLRAKDAAGNNLPVGGATVVFSTSGGTSTGSFSSVVDHGDGRYTANFTGFTAGSATQINATIQGSNVTSGSPTVIVTPGAVSPANSLVSVAAATVQSGSQVGVTLQARDAAGNHLTSGGATVAFNRSGGTSTGSFSGTIDNLDGTYSAQFTGIIAGSSTQIGATVGGIAVATTLPSVTVVPGPVSLAQSTVNVIGGAASVASGNSLNINLTTRDSAGNLLGAGGLAVAFNFGGGTSTASFGSVTDQGDGTYRAVLTGVVSGTASSVGATIGGFAVTSTLPTLVVLPGSPSPSTSLITVTQAAIASGDTGTVSLALRDINNNVLTTNGGATVAFSHSGGVSTLSFASPVDNSNGSFSSVYSGVLAGAATQVRASINGAPVTTSSPTVTVSPGIASPANSLVQVGSATVVSGLSTSLTLRARDAAGNLLSVGGSTVVFARSGGTSTGNISAVTDNGDGSYSATFTGAASGTPTTITATVDGINVTSTLPVITVVPGAISAANSVVTVTATTVNSGAGITVRLQGKDVNGNNLISGGSTVAFAHSGGSATGNISAVLDNADGSYQATFTGVLAGTATTITATIDGDPVTTTLPSVAVTPGPASVATSVVTLSSGTVVSGSTVTATLRTKDAAGNNLSVGGMTIAFSVAGGTSTAGISGLTDNLDGTYTATLTGILAGTASSVSASINGSPVTTILPTLTVTPGAPSPANSLITVASATVSSGSSVVVTLRARDAAGNFLVVGGDTVVFSRAGGTSTGSFAGLSDLGNGQYTANFTGLVSGTPTTIGATVNGISVTSTLPTVQVVPGPISPVTSVVSVASAVISSGSATAVTLQGRDANNNVVTSGGAAVVFSNNGGTSTGNFGTLTDNGDGTYTTSFTGVTSGSATNITASVGGVGVSTAQPTVTVTPGSAHPANSLITVSSGTVQSTQGVTLTLRAKDAAGNNLVTGGATVSFSYSGGTSTGTIGSVTNVGDGTYTAVFTGVIAGSATTINALLNGSPITSVRPTVTVVPGPVSLVKSVVDVIGNPGIVAGGGTATLRLRARDANDNAISSGGLTIGFSYAGGTSTGSIGTVSDQLNGSYTGVFTGALVGTAVTISATIGGQVVTYTPLPTLTVVPGNFDLSTSAVTVSATTVNSGSTINATLTTRDSFGNPLTAGGLTTAFSHANGTSTGSFAAPVDNGNGTYTSTFTGQISGTPTEIRATINGSNVTSAAPNVTVNPGSPSATQSLISVSAATVQSGQAVTLTLTTKDAAGNFVTSGGATVSFSFSGGTSTGTISSQTDNGNGTYSATFTGVTAGTATSIRALLNSSSVTTTLPTVQVLPGAISAAHSTVTVASASVASGATTTITLQAKDLNNNNVPSGGDTVAFSVSGGTSTGSISGTSDVGNGTYTATFQGILAGSATTVGALVNGSPVTTSMPTISVVPGAISATQSTVTTSVSTVASGSNAVLTLQAKDAAGNTVTVGGATIAFGHSGGTSTGSAGSTTDNGNGTYTANFTGLVAGTPTTITATVNTSNVTTTMPAITVIPGPPSPSQSLVSVSAGTLSSGASVTLTLTAKDAGGNTLTTGGAIVTFSHSGGGSTGTVGSVADNGNGTYSATFTGVLAGSATTIQATVNGSSVTTTLPTVQVTPGTISAATSVASVSAASVASGNSVTISLQAKDAAGNNLTSGGATVAFGASGGTSTGSVSATTYAGSGVYTATFTGILAGTAKSVTATINGTTVTTTMPTVTVVPGAISVSQSTVTVSASTVASGSSVTLTLQGKDAAGNSVTSGGASVAFGHSGGVSTGSVGTVADNGNGTYSASFMGLVAGSATTITATIGGSTVTTTMPTVTVVPGPPSAAQSLVSVSSSTVQSGGTVTLTLTTKDAGGNTLTSGGATVAFNRSGGGSTGTIVFNADNGNGTYSATFTGVTAGSPTTIGANLNGIAVSTTLPTIQVTPGLISATTSVVTVSAASVASGGAVTIRLQAKDANNNNLTIGGSTVDFAVSGGTSTGSLSAVTDVGDGTYTRTFTGILAGTATTVSATINGSNVTTSMPTITVVPGGISAAQSLVSVSAGSVSSGSSIQLTLQAKDSAGNNISAGGSTIVFTRSGGASTGTIGTTTDNGNGTYQASFTGVLAGSATTIQATINGVSVTSTLPTVTVTPGAASPVQSLISVSSASVLSGNSVTLTLTTKDAAGNSITTGGQTVTFNFSGGSSTGSITGLTDNTNGTYSATFTGITAGSATTIGSNLNGSAVTTTPPTIQVLPGTISTNNSIVSVSSATVASGSSVTVTLQAKDVNNNSLSVGGATVNFSVSGGTSTGSWGAVVDGGNGTYTRTFTGILAGTATTVAASINGSAVTTTMPSITVLPGAISIAQSMVSVSSSSVASGNSITLSLQGKDANGNNLTTGGSTIVFTQSGGSSNGNISTTTDNGNGTYTATFAALTSGTATTIGATVGGSAVTSTLPTVTVIPGVVSLAQSTLSTSISTVASGATATLTLRAKDGNGNQLTTGGLAVVLSSSGGTSTGSITGLTDNNDGTYTATFNAVATGTATTLRATIGGSNITSTLPTITVVPGAISAATSTLTVSSATVNSGSSITATLQAKDANGNNLTSGGATLSFSRSGGTSTGTFGSYTDHADGTYSVAFTGLAAGSATTLTTTINGTPLATTLPSVTVLPGAISVAQSIVTVSAGTVVSGASVTLTLQAKDGNGNSLTSGGSLIAFGRSGGASTGTITGATDNNNGTYTATFTGVLAGAATTITATIGGVSVTSSLPTVTVTPGAFNLSQSIITVGSASVAAGSTSSLTLTVKDAAGNSLTTGGLTVVFTQSGGSSTGTITGLNDNNNGTYSATFNASGVGTARTIGATINGSPVTSTLPTITVVPGNISAAHSIISVSSATVSSGNSVTVTLQAKDAYNNNLTVGGATVAFSRSGGTSTGVLSGYSDNSDGTYTANFQGINAGTATTINATINGTPVTSTLPTIQVLPGAISLANSFVTVASPTVASGNNVTATFHSRDSNNNTILVGGQTILFNRSGGTSTGSFAGTSDNADGTYSSVFTGLVSGSPTFIGATVGGSSLTSSLPTVQVLVGAFSAANSTVAVSSSTVAAGTTATFTLTARDVNNNAFTTGGATVTFPLSGGTSNGSLSATTDNNNGTYTATFTGTTVGTAVTVGGVYGGVSVTSTLPTVTVVPGGVSLSQSSTTVSQSTITSGATSTLTFTARDAYGNPITTGGRTVGFSYTGGVSTGSIGSFNDLGNGTYTAVFTGVLAGTATSIRTSVDGSNVTSTSPTITVNPGAYSVATSLVTLSSSSVQSGSTVTATLTAKDAAGNSITSGGLTVLFARSGGTSQGTFAPVSDIGNGTYTSVFTGTVAGTPTNITATINSAAVTSTSPTLQVTPGGVSLSQSTISVSSPTVASGSNVTLTLQAKDASGNNLTSGGLIVAFSRSGGVSTGTIGGTTDNGDGTYTATFTGQVAGSATSIGATIGGATVVSTSPTVQVLPGPASLSQSLVSVGSSTVASGGTVTLSLQAKDANGNNLTGGGLNVAFGRAGGSSSGTIGSTTDNGNGTYSALFTATTAGTATTITSTIGGAAVTSSLPTIQVTPGGISLSSSSVTLTANTVAAGSTVTATLQLKDANGNNISTTGQTVLFTKASGTSNGTFAPVVDNGDGTYSAIFTGTTAGTTLQVGATIGGSAVTSASQPLIVTPGPLSLADSTVSVSSATLASGSAITLSFQAKDAYANNVPNGSYSVAFGKSGGTSNGNFGTATHQGNGLYQASFTGTAAGTAATITALVNSSPVTSTLPTVTVTPGTASPATSTITLSSSSVQSGNTVTITFQAKDAFGNNLTSGGDTVTFSRAGGTSTGTVGPTVDNGNGTHTAVFTGLVSGTATTISANLNAAPVTTTSPTVTVTPGVFSLANSTIAVSSATVVSGSSVTATLTTRDAQGNLLTTGGLTVAFSHSGGVSTGSFTGLTDNANGTYTATFNGLVAGTPTSIRATINTSTVTSTSPTVQVLPGPVSLANSNLTVSSANISSGATSTLTLRARDANNNPLTTGGLVVDFAYSGGTSTGTISGTTDQSNGYYTAVFTGVNAGSATSISATIAASPVTSTSPTITVSAGASTAANSLVSVSSPTVVSGSAVTLTLQARDSAGNNITVGGSSVTFSYTGGSSTGSISGVTDNGNGTYTATFTGNVAGSATTIAAIIDSSPVTSTLPTLQVTPGAISVAKSLITVQSATLVAGATTLVTLQARDANDNIISTGGQSIAFSTSGGTSAGSFSGVTDNSNGTYSANFLAATAGTASTVNATINTTPVTSPKPTITVTPAAVSVAHSTVSVSTSSIVAGNTSTVTIQSKDAYGNNLTTGGLSVSPFRTGGGSSGTFGTLTDNGNGSYTVVFTGTSAGTATTIGANIGGSPITTTLPTITVQPGSISLSQSTVSLTANTVAAGSTITATLQAKDSYGNNLTSGGQTVIFSRTGGTSSGAFSATTDNLNGTYSANFQGSTAGTPTTVQVTVGGANVTSTMPTITVIPGTVSLANSTVTVNGGATTVASSSSITVRLTARDAYNNQLNSGGLSVTFDRTGGSSTGSFGTVNDNSDGTYSVLFTGAIAGTPTTLRGRIGGSLLTSTFPDVTVLSGPASLSGSTLSVSANTVLSGNSVNVTLTAKDVNGNTDTSGTLPVSFNFSGGTSTGNFGTVTYIGAGQYRAVFTGVVSGTTTQLIGRISGADLTSGTQSMTVGPGAASAANSIITSAAGSVLAGNTVLVTLQAKDAAGNTKTSGGDLVAFNTSGGTSSGSFSSVTDNGNGTYSANFQGLVAGTPTSITATINATTVTTTLPAVQVNPGPISLSQSTVTVSGSTVVSSSTRTITVTLRDAYSNQMQTGGRVIAIANTTGGGISTGTISGVSDNSNGTYSATFTGLLVGSPTTISATVDGSTITSTSPTIQVTPGAISTVKSRVLVGATQVIEGNTTTVTLQARDANDNALTSGGATIVFSRTGGTSVGSFSGYLDNSNGTYTATFTATTGGTPTTIGATINGSNVSWGPLPTIEVLPLPQIADQPDRVFAATSPNPLTVGANMSFDLVNLVTGNDTNMTYSCVFDRIPDGTIASGANCTTLPGTATFNTATGVFSWTPNAVGQGAYEIRLTGTNLVGSATQYTIVNVKSDYPSAGLLVDLDGNFGNYYRNATNSPLVDSYKNLRNLNPIVGYLNNFAMTTTSGWAGDGTVSGNGSASSLGPYRLAFNQADSTYVGLGTDLTNTSVLASFWIKPASPTAGLAHIISNGGLTGNGYAVYQTPAQDVYPATTGGAEPNGAGMLELAVAGIGSLRATIPVKPIAYYRMDEASGATALADDAATYTMTDATGGSVASTAGYGSSTQLNRGYESTAVNFNGSKWFYNSTQMTTANNVGTVEFWFKTTTAANAILWSTMTSTPATNPSCNNSGVKIYTEVSGRLAYGIRDINGSVVRHIYSNAAVNDGNWHHVVATWKSNSRFLYIDGVQQGSEDTAVIQLANARRSRIGGGEWGNCGFKQFNGTNISSTSAYSIFNGAIDEVALYHTYEMDATTVLARYRNYACRTQALTQNVFTHVGITYDSSTRVAKMYMNGAEECSMTLPSGASIVGSRDLTLGAKPLSSSYSNYWTGGISDLKIYNGGGASEMVDLYNFTSPKHP